MTLPTMTRTPDGYHRAELDGLATGKYTNQVSALRVLCEMLATQAAGLTKKLYPWRATGPCECDGWGTPTGCPGCGIKCMGG